MHKIKLILTGLFVSLLLFATNAEAAKNDFNGDGNADILWQKDNGTYVIWLMSGSGRIGSIRMDVNTGWLVKDISDFNGDGKADILWRKNNGKYDIWLMSESGRIGSISIATMTASWNVAKSSNCYISITQQMLTGKVFYRSERVDDDDPNSNVIYAKITATSPTNATVREITIDVNDIVVDDVTHNVSYELVNGLMIIDLGDKYVQTTLQCKDQVAWYVSTATDRGKRGVYEPPMDDTLWLNKPADFPAAL